ncbi:MULTISPECIES: class F sortase [unclassified Knoellia]|uniref:class F sortase n=1 Tax=Knoellia altitudinis TaxID=3404795 RepID=UPI003616BC94
MTDDRTGRSRRLTASAAAVMAFGLLGIGATGYALSQQAGAPPEVVADQAGHVGHGGDPSPTTPAPSSTASPSASASGSAQSPHAGHGGTAPAGAAYETPKGTLMERSRPTKVTLPGIGASAPIIDLKLKSDKRMEVPDNGTEAGWFTSSPTPGELGPAIIAAHVTHKSKPAVFFELSGMRKGEKIEVEREDGTTATFAVTSVGQYPKAKFPSEQVYGSVDRAALRLITCGGVLDGETGSHVDNVVVYADLVS